MYCAVIFGQGLNTLLGTVQEGEVEARHCMSSTEPGEVSSDSAQQVGSRGGSRPVAASLATIDLSAVCPRNIAPSYCDTSTILGYCVGMLGGLFL